MKVFVYGTLMRDRKNHSVMEGVGGKFLREGTTAKKFAMYDLGAFPGVKPFGDEPFTEKVAHIKGELYEVSKEGYEKLQAFEGVPHLYRDYSVNVRASSTSEQTKYENKLNKSWEKACKLMGYDYVLDVEDRTKLEYINRLVHEGKMKASELPGPRPSNKAHAFFINPTGPFDLKYAETIEDGQWTQERDKAS